MKHLYLDIRGADLKALVTEGQTVKYAKVFDPFLLSDTGAGELVRKITEESGPVPDSVHIIVPPSDVKIKRYRLQKMPLEDARLIISRRISSEEGIKSPLFHLTPLAPDGQHQEFAAAVVEPEGLRKYSSLFDRHGVRLKTVTTSFHAKLKVLGEDKGAAHQTSAIFEITAGTIEIMVVSPSRIIAHELLTISSSDTEETSGGQDRERIQKKRLYEIIDALYKFVLFYRENAADQPIDRVLLCGRDSSMKEIAGALEEAVGVQVSLWNPFGPEVADGSGFVPLLGLSLGVQDGTAANLISPSLLGRRQPGPGLLTAAVLAFSVLAFTAAFLVATENRYRNTLKLLDAEISETKRLSGSRASQGGAARPAAGQASFYGVFRYLANSLPKDIALEEVLLRREGGEDFLQLSFVARDDPAMVRNRRFTALVESINSSGRLSLMKGPVLSAASKEPGVHFQMLCRIIPNEDSR